MSLRRSARNTSTKTPDTPEASIPNDISQSKAKVGPKAATGIKKRKTRASNPSTTAAAADDIMEASLRGAMDMTESKPDFVIPELPTTPIPKRRKAANATTPLAPPPFTPTPSSVGLIAIPSSGGKDEKPRPTEPHLTNATLATPGGSRVVAYSSSPIKAAASLEDSVPSASPSKRKAKDVVPPDMGVQKLPTSTTETLLQDACAHLLNADPKLKGLVEKHHCKTFSPEGLSEVVDPFTSLSSGIIGQQVSGQAAASIRAKFTALFPDTHPSFPSPAQVIEKDLPTLRTAGLSQRKAEYISGLAEKFVSGEFTAQMLISAPDDELIEKLVAVRGLGRWSVEMFACFGLKRMDVFSTGDLGVQRGMATYMGRDVSKLKAKGGKWKYMTEKEMLDIAAKFSPYR
ncbi:DNA glycosylase [Amniculicola lignicola CBS 123094]|uniref:DNA glycosylase n=1 Tax=Amniculicola lignicola CBS 123094 TaxID=1392246 RepID=A0A6A5WUG0_9PLEO|nr:DNA glycosylase [Amniculicola lignicola CBS 123094]